jgi:hypothetical protein
MRRARLSPPEEGAVRELVDAVHAFADDPGPTNLQRYLAVSRELEESRCPRASAAQVAAEPKARTRERRRTRRPASVDATRADA